MNIPDEVGEFWVCPTYVGMNRKMNKYQIDKYRMPHVCGDEPGKTPEQVAAEQYAPRMWG